MDGFGRACLHGDGFTARKCRTDASRRPCSDVRKLLQTSALLPPNGQSFGDGGRGEDCSFWKAALGSGVLESESRPKKLKLKLGGLTRTIHPKFTAESAFNGGSSSLNSSERSVVPQSQVKLLVKGPSTKAANLRNLSGKSFHVYETPLTETVRKSKRIPKRRVMDDEFDVDDSTLDEEICYLGRLDAPKVFAYHDDVKGERIGIKRRRIDENVDNHVSSKLLKNGRQKPIPVLLHSTNRHYTEVEHNSDDDDLGYTDSRNESGPPAHGWSLKSGGGHIEYPNGLPALPPKKHKGKLSELEQQVKRAEAAQRRKIQAEKAAREAEEEAIRKILGQDSARKKREEKMKKQNAQVSNGALGPKAIRWINRPAGNVVVFGDDVSLPDIFNSLPCSYPPPREKCAGPDCSNEYKYRDSKLKVPLCSLHCYRAIHQKMELLTSC